MKELKKKLLNFIVKVLQNNSIRIIIFMLVQVLLILLYYLLLSYKMQVVKINISRPSYDYVEIAEISIYSLCYLILSMLSFNIIKNGN